MNVFSALNQIRNSGQKSVAVLVDPDDAADKIRLVAETALVQGIELFLVGGSLVTDGNTHSCAALLKSLGAKYVVLFPGNEIQVTAEADAILFMSLVSGRNPEFLIGKQVNAAPWVRKAGLETLPTAYMLVESGKLTSALYMSHTLPLPSNKPDIAAATALAAEMLGMKLFYMDAGSGADQPVPAEMIERVKNTVAGTIIVGGGIRSAAEAETAWNAGADVVVVGNGAFENVSIIQDMARVCKKLNTPQFKV
ncbi:MAG: geranylgeranylglyceryl/heptaprenylglyceryl phosphate synthase [Bacteroidia bacterium]|nr:geranylgeranylglyceryl/heptaprenylglyceryl phosphate synthase [Bacteroidia bacterium]